MKVRVVSGEEVTAKRGLAAVPYVDPTRHVDKQIATAKRTLKATKQRLRNLEAERARILSSTKTTRLRRIDETCRRCDAVAGIACRNLSRGLPTATVHPHRHQVELAGYCDECDHPEREHEDDPDRYNYERCMHATTAPDGGVDFACNCMRRADS